MKLKCVATFFVPTHLTFTTLINKGHAFYIFPAPINKPFIFTFVTTKFSLSTRQGIIASLPYTIHMI